MDDEEAVSGSPELADVANLRREYQRFIEVQWSTYLKLRDALDAAADVFRVIRVQLEQDRPVRELRQFIDPRPLRTAITGGLAEFEQAREEGQRMLFQLLVAEGATLDDISRVWDIPRELVEVVIDDRDD